MKQQLIVNKQYIAIIFLYAIASMLSARSSREAGENADAQALTNAVASINGTFVSELMLSRKVKQLVLEMLSQGVEAPPPNEELFEIALQNIISEELLYQESRKKRIKVDKSQVEQQFEVWRQQFSDEQTYMESLSYLDITEAELKSEFERSIAIQDLIQRKFKAASSIPDAELLEFYNNNEELFSTPEQVHVRHIVIFVDEDADEDQKESARKKIEDVQEKLLKGDDFAELARQFSDGPSAPDGGDLGVFQRGDMIKPFEDAAFELEVGKISDIVITPNGYHLIQLLGKQAGFPMQFANVKSQIEQHLIQLKLTEEINQFIDQLRSDADIEIF